MKKEELEIFDGNNRQTREALTALLSVIDRITDETALKTMVLKALDCFKNESDAWDNMDIPYRKNHSKSFWNRHFHEVDIIVNAVGRITEQAYLKEIVRQATNQSTICEAATKGITDQSYLALEHPYCGVRAAAAGQTANQEMLKKIVLNDPHCAVREAAIVNVTDMDVLGEVLRREWRNSIRKPAWDNLKAAGRSAGLSVGNVEERIHVRYEGNHYSTSVPSEFSLMFRGDIYGWSVLEEATKKDIRRTEAMEDIVRINQGAFDLLEDRYGRLWLHACYEDFLRPYHDTYQLVADEEDADTAARYYLECRRDKTSEDWMKGKTGKEGRLPYFHADYYPWSNKPGNEFCIELHDDPMEETPGYAENKKKELIELNK
ncbi:hypothetical protein AGMMS49574_03730 [Bacteroidia bacterium]|nr:hypothetical protein AGMMS49574_03730 [Bacteroidia bacterium]